MPKKLSRRENLLRLQKLITPLTGLPEFVDFMKEVRVMRDAAVTDMCNDQVAANDNLLRAALGEVRAYDSILSLYLAKAEEKEQAEQPIAQD